MAKIAGQSSRIAKFFRVEELKNNISAVICCEISGNGSPIILIPGLGDTVWVWKKLIPYIESKYKVFALEQRGHGRSSSPVGPYKSEDFENDLYKLLEHTGVDSPVIIGHGFGGMIALNFSIRYPEIASGIVAISPEFFIEKDLHRIHIQEGLELAYRKDMHGAYKKRRESKREPKGMSSKERAEHHRLFLKNDSMGYSHSCSANLEILSNNQKIKDLSIPVLLVYGELDIKQKESITISSNLPSNFENIIVDRAGSYVHLDKPESLEHLIYEFIMKNNLQFKVKDTGETQ
tara:strand:+ start:6991 stop:7863 length:873 start_codon:yes stop_codon:yes gene_type:complete